MTTMIEIKMREAFENAVRALTDPANHHDTLARDEYAHDGYAQWPTALAWEVWKISSAAAYAAGMTRAAEIAGDNGWRFVADAIRAEISKGAEHG